MKKKGTAASNYKSFSS